MTIILKSWFKHTALYLEDIHEEKASKKLKSLFPEHREYLLQLYSQSNVDTGLFKGLKIIFQSVGRFTTWLLIFSFFWPCSFRCWPARAVFEKIFLSILWPFICFLTFWAYNGVQQVVLTSLVHQNDWFSSDTGIQYGPDKPAYIVGKVKKGALTWERVLLDTFYPENK